jgi:hypothetical protein
MITITVETGEEDRAVTDALRDGILHEVLGESLTIRISNPRRGSGGEFATEPGNPA